MKESTIRQVITGIIHGGQEITKESAGYAAGKGVEIMEFLKENNLLYGNFIPDPPAPPKDRTPDNPVPTEAKPGCQACQSRITSDFCVRIKENSMYCTGCGKLITGPRIII